MIKIFLIFLIFIFLYIFFYLNNDEIIYVLANDGKKYLVYKDGYNIEKANLLSKIVSNMFKLKTHLVKNKNNFPDFKKYIDLLDDNLNENTVFYESDPNTNLTSYSVNKGEEIAMCIKSKKNGQLHNINLLMYVAIHEMSHIACPESGENSHGPLFKQIFHKFLEEAINIGIYTKYDYSTYPTEYCGMTLNTSII